MQYHVIRFKHYTNASRTQHSAIRHHTIQYRTIHGNSISNNSLHNFVNLMHGHQIQCNAIQHKYNPTLDLQYTTNRTHMQTILQRNALRWNELECYLMPVQYKNTHIQYNTIQYNRILFKPNTMPRERSTQ
jgi:hypothetical protein